MTDQNAYGLAYMPAALRGLMQLPAETAARIRQHMQVELPNAASNELARHGVLVAAGVVVTFFIDPEQRQLVVNTVRADTSKYTLPES